MKKTIRKYLSLILVAVMTSVLFSACGNSSASSAASEAKSSADTAQQAASSAEAEAAAPAADAIVLKWGDHYPSGTPGAVAIDTFCASVGEATEGRVVIETYHDAVLGSAADALSIVSSGTADIVWTSSAIFNGQFPYTEIMALPMLGVSDAIEGTDILYDLLEKYPDAFAEEYANYHVLMLHCGPSNLVGTTKTVSSLGDLAGLNIRAGTGTPTAIATLWGATPVMIATPDLYTSVQKGVVDGYIFDGSGISTWGLAELTDTMLDCSLGCAPCLVLMNQGAWDKISAEDQAIINELAGREGGKLLAAAMQGEADEMEKTFEGTFLRYQPGDEKYEELRAPLVSYIDEWAEKMTTDTVDAKAMIDDVLNYNG